MHCNYPTQLEVSTSTNQTRICPLKATNKTKTMAEEEKPEIILLKSGSKNETKIRKGITWDEETIAMHDIERGTRMEINEPDTPYYHGSSSQSDDEEPHTHSLSARQKTKVDLNDLSSRLFEYYNQVNESLDHSSSSDRNNSFSSPTQKSKQDVFREKRKLHYKEFITAKSRSSKPNHSDSDSDANR